MFFHFWVGILSLSFLFFLFVCLFVCLFFLNASSQDLYVCGCDYSCCRFCSPEVSWLHFRQLFTQQPVFHSWSVTAHLAAQSCNMPLVCSWFYILIHSKEQVCRWQPGVSSSNTNLAERHRRLLWRSPKEAWEGKPETQGGWGWRRGWRQWDVKGHPEVSLNITLLQKFYFWTRRQRVMASTIGHYYFYLVRLLLHSDGFRPVSCFVVFPKYFYKGLILTKLYSSLLT